jgi:putative ABC transport system permease protein
MGILRAVGVAQSVVWLIVVAEGVVIGVLSWVLAALLAWPLNQALGNLLIKVMFKSIMNFRFEVVGAFIWFIVSLCLGVIASFLSAWHAVRRPLCEAIGYE